MKVGQQIPIRLCHFFAIKEKKIFNEFKLNFSVLECHIFCYLKTIVIIINNQR